MQYIVDQSLSCLKLETVYSNARSETSGDFSGEFQFYSRVATLESDIRNFI